jgi:hypothetical protein
MSSSQLRNSYRIWIRKMREEGRLIVDIGPDFSRRVQRWKEGEVPWSWVYNMERMELKGYENIRKSFGVLGSGVEEFRA